MRVRECNTQSERENECGCGLVFVCVRLCVAQTLLSWSHTRIGHIDARVRRWHFLDTFKHDLNYIIYFLIWDTLSSTFWARPAFLMHLFILRTYWDIYLMLFIYQKLFNSIYISKILLWKNIVKILTCIKLWYLDNVFNKKWDTLSYSIEI